MCVSICRKNFKDSIFDGKQCYIKSSATKIKDKNVLFSFVFVQSVSNSCCSRFVNDSHNGQTSNCSRILGSLALCIIEVSWNSNYSVGYFFTQEVFSSSFHLLQNHGTDFFRSELFCDTIYFDFNEWF
mmetsp:Transcript_8658/g.10940  ORF Transcript_8658/g.10940 Transcript_8658/m.10940 type:complete len:128 (+) Transcript_8658:312-695(+)